MTTWHGQGPLKSVSTYAAESQMVLTFALLLALSATCMGDGPRPFLFLKTGDKFATQKIAGPTLAGLTAYMGEKLSGTTNVFFPHVLNHPVRAVEFCAASKPTFGIVTPGFYLAYAGALKMKPLLETKRRNVNEERYVLVAKKEAGSDPSAYQGKKIATPIAAEERYVKGVVLGEKFGNELRLIPTMDVEGALFDVVDGVEGAADAVLIEEASWEMFEDDPEYGSQLQVVYRSDRLPENLVVVFCDNARDLSADRVKKILKGMADDEQGKKILSRIRVEAFEDADQERLGKARRLFHGEKKSAVTD